VHLRSFEFFRRFLVAIKIIYWCGNTDFKKFVEFLRMFCGFVGRVLDRASVYLSVVLSEINYYIMNWLLNLC
jgi:hypothetical protein